MNEIWKPVVGYKGLYEVSNYGKVRSLDRVDSYGRRRKGRMLLIHRNNCGYSTVSTQVAIGGVMNDY